jgi:type IV secretory pathway component VirB8
VLTPTPRHYFRSHSVIITIIIIIITIITIITIIIITIITSLLSYGSHLVDIQLRQRILQIWEKGVVKVIGFMAK